MYCESCNPSLALLLAGKRTEVATTAKGQDAGKTKPGSNWKYEEGEYNQKPTDTTNVEAPKEISYGNDSIPGKGTNSTSSNPIINPATNKVVTEHTIVPSGKAPKTSTPNLIYEVSRADGSRSVTYYDEKGNMFSREDYGQQRIHGNLEFDKNGKVVPHEHKQTYKSYNGKIYKDKSYYRQIDENGKPVGPWILDK
ncbi:hypothetical protein A9G11_05100 [Gilliamella sp. wkB108]|uniref:hypothetical protein n=1 Tax=Gilliamella sp. wkB108 TaxID=3120256 RepID=UPI00080EA6BD|nr:hypothetical protein [Gilliamella apicola]OCG23810.1 hypothetical protein A9G11_05100 [Gilliamella apicola]